MTAPAEDAPARPAKPVLDGTPRVGRVANRSDVIKGVVLAVGPFRGRVAILSAFALVAGLVDTMLLYAVARLGLLLTDPDNGQVDVSLGPLGRHSFDMTGLMALAGVLLVAAVALNLPIARITATLSRDTMLRQRRRLINAYLRSSWTHRSGHSEGHLQEYMMSYSNRSEGVVQQIAAVIVMAWSIVTIAIASIVIARVVALLGLVCLGLMSLLLRPVAKRVKAHAAHLAALNRGFSSRVAQTARVSPEITTFDVPGAVARAREEEAALAGRAVMRLRFLSKATPIIFQYTTLAVLIGIIYVLAEFDLGDLDTIGPLMLLLVRGLSSARQLQTSTQQILQTVPYVERLEEEIGRLDAHAVADGTVDIDHIGPIAIEGVSFSYVEGVPVLSGVDVVIQPGDAVGVIGPSGGGKSTLSQLLVRLRPPSSGRILVDEVDLADVTSASWSRLIAMVPQDNSLIRATVADNIRFFREGLSDEDVVAASQAAHLHEAVIDLPDGYDTEIGPGARELSGGQRQRLGIARALVGRPELLVLDEPTSALDRESEELIRQTLEALRGSTTLIVVAHRPATLEICNRVLQVSDTVVVELSDPNGSNGGSARRTRPLAGRTK